MLNGQFRGEARSLNRARHLNNDTTLIKEVPGALSQTWGAVATRERWRSAREKYADLGGGKSNEIQRKKGTRREEQTNFVVHCKAAGSGWRGGSVDLIIRPGSRGEGENPHLSLKKACVLVIRRPEGKVRA